MSDQHHPDPRREGGKGSLWKGLGPRAALARLGACGRYAAPALLALALVPAAVAGEAARPAGVPFEEWSWYVRLTVEAPAAGLSDSNNVLGQLPDSLLGHDSHDLVELAPFASPYLTVVFPHPAWGERAGVYASDYHPVRPGRRDSWTFEVRSDNAERAVTLSWIGPPEVLADSYVLDLVSGEVVQATAGPYTFVMEAPTRAFEWRYRTPLPKKR